MKESRSKWSKIVHNFLDSGLELIKLYEPVHPETAAICLRHYLDGKKLPVFYSKRGNYIYIYRTDCTTASIEEAIEGVYANDDNGLLRYKKRPYWLDYTPEQIRKHIKEMQT